MNDGFGPPPRSRAMRRRVVVFSAVFLVCALLSLAYTFSRPAVYQAGAKVQVTPQIRSAVNDAAAQQDNTQAFLVEMQVFTSRPLLEKVAARLKERGRQLGPADETDPVPMLQQMLTVDPLVGTNVAQIEAHGPERLLVADLVNTVIDVYREEQVRGGEEDSRRLLADAREEARVMDTRVAERRKAVEAFRLRADIVSAERDENQVLARLKGMGTSLAAANDREATAEGRLRAIEQAAAEGRLAPLSKDNPTLASMEQRLSQWREEWRALERQFTPNYLGMDPDARALKMRIDSLEQQIETERGKSLQNALAIAREELAGARAASKRLQQQAAEDRQSVQSFSRNFGEFKTMQDELDGLEKLRQAAQQRLMALEASENTRRPRVQVLERATTPESAWRPLYARDAAIGVAASLVLAFLAVWFVEFFNRVEAVPAAPSTVLVPQPWMPYPDPRLAPATSAAPLLARDLGAADAATDLPLLAQPLPRELHATEAEALLAAAAPQDQPLLACLLCGLRPAEIATLRAANVDLAAGTLVVAGDSRRVLPLPAAWLEAMQADKSADAWLFPGPDGAEMQPEDIEALVTSSAHDAHLVRPHEVTAETLRHTYIAHLVRQGLRFSELSRLVGRLSAEALNRLAALAPASQRVSLDAVETLLPGVRQWVASAAGSEA
ncbi:hypothetical protein RD110_26110 [Rhodoferax koreense]|uniref:Tyr recombinase domain-containing protein n=1 Tax=Rhodoferax koreensis TaxID=1842727 RepID=A0A1P8K2K6_9BURK|nr:hypothetical protein RD110_26110 [Rhodoferax koreense]